MITFNSLFIFVYFLFDSPLFIGKLLANEQVHRLTVVGTCCKIPEAWQWCLLLPSVGSKSKLEQFIFSETGRCLYVQGQSLQGKSSGTGNAQ